MAVASAVEERWGLRLELDVFVDSAQTSRGACAWVGKAGSLTRARAGQDGPPGSTLGARQLVAGGGAGLDSVVRGVRVLGWGLRGNGTGFAEGYGLF